MPKSSKKLPDAKQSQFFDLIGRLINTGYSINESVRFINNLWRKDKWVDDVSRSLSKGINFAQSVEKFVDSSFNFQLSMAVKYGTLTQTLNAVAKFSENKLKQKNKIKQTMKYPVVLLVLLMIAFFVILIVLIPMMKKSIDVGETLVDKSIFKISVIALPAFIVVILSLFYIFMKSLTPLRRMEFLIKIPIIGKPIRILANYQFAFQFGLLIQSGLEVTDILNDISQIKVESVETQLAKNIAKEQKQGRSLVGTLKQISFIDETIVLFFDQGSTKNRIATDLLLYSSLLYEDFIKSIDKILELIQPTIFIVIALLIVFVYLVLLLPMYQNLGGGII